jgi:hypothetical protein
MDTTTSTGSRRRVTVAITTALAAAAVAIAASPGQPFDLRSTDPGADTSRQAPAPADPAGAFVFHNSRFTPLGKIPGAAAAGHVNVNNRGQVVGLYIDAAEAATTPPGQLPPIRSFVKDPRGRGDHLRSPRRLGHPCHRHQRPRPDRRHLVRCRRHPYAADLGTSSLGTGLFWCPIAQAWKAAHSNLRLRTVARGVRLSAWRGRIGKAKCLNRTRVTCGLRPSGPNRWHGPSGTS